LEEGDIVSYRLKGDYIILDGGVVKFVPKELPENPELWQIVVDQLDGKLKIWNGVKWTILGDANDIEFDNTGSNLISNNAGDAIKEIENRAFKRRDIISFTIDGNSRNKWFSQNDNGSSTNKTFYVPPYDCRILRVTFANDSKGNNSNPLHTEVKAHCKHYDTEGDITTNSEVAWYVNSDGENIVNYGEDGRTWVYNNASEGDFMYSDYRYAFRCIRTSGNAQPNNATINIYVEEL
jgi:hypothetical protein